MEWSWPAYVVSVGAVIVSGALAWLEGHWRKRPGLGMGFVDHGGMWSDLVLLSLANAVIVPHLAWGWWVAAAAGLGTAASVAVHAYWYRPDKRDEPVPPAALDADDASRDGDDRNLVECHSGAGDHMWPAHTHGTWARDLSWAGWAHVIYVAGELTILAGFALHAVPPDLVILVAVIFTVHVPIGLLQPQWFLTGHIATVQEQPLLGPLLLALWAVTAVKL